MLVSPALEKVLSLALPSPHIALSPRWQGIEQIQLKIKRDDTIHPIISGNKWRKLALPMQQLTHEHSPMRGIISFGGGYSNHLHALGYCCHQLQVPFIPIVRGNYTQRETPMLKDLLEWNINPLYVTKIDYQKRHDQHFLDGLRKQYPHYVVIPEGGSQEQALYGMAAMMTELKSACDYIVAPVASGGTLAGIIAAAKPHQTIIGIAVLKGQGYLEELVENLLPNRGSNHPKWCILHDYHHGGYAKSSPPLIDFCQSFIEETNIAVEPVYSGKLFFALQDLISQRYFHQGAKVTAIHTGGLQSARQ